MKKILAVLLAALMLFALTACSVSSSSTSTTTVTTSKTDENGNTTTNTVTSEVGVSAGTDGVTTTNQTTETTTTTSADSGVTSDELRDALAGKFSAGAEGVSKDGDKVLFVYDDPETFSYGALAVVMDNGQSLMGREGQIVLEGDQYKLIDEDMDSEVPFGIQDGDDENSFVMIFQDGDTATMTIMDVSTVIDDMVATMAEFSA